MVREAILRGQLASGARVNEQELARGWNVSRTPIRDALRRLEAEGLVQTVPGRGVVVARPSRVDVDELYEILEALEGLAARRTAERATAAIQVQLNELIKAYGAALKQGDHERWAAAAGALHLTVARAALNRRLERTIETLRGQTAQAEERADRVKGRATRTFRELAKLTAAIRGRDGARAEASMREHLASLRADAAAAWPEGERAGAP
jgi:DNA-binding GntR family transcriptional regulator